MLDKNLITKKIVSKLESIGIDATIDGNPSHTAKMIDIIVSEIISALKTDAEIHTAVTTDGTPTHHTGFGIGKVT